MSQIYAIDHIVLAVANVEKSREFYAHVLGIKATQTQTGKWFLQLSGQRINLQPADDIPQIARNTLAGSANFCLRTKTPLAEVIQLLKKNKVVILDGPAIKEGANGPIRSVYFNDLDGNLIEVSNEIEPN